MGLTSRLRGKGQLTIPREIRREARLREGSILEFEIVDEGVLIRPRLLIDTETAIDAAFAREVIAQTEAGYAELRADPAAWAEELRERELWESTLPDSLDG